MSKFTWVLKIATLAYLGLFLITEDIDYAVLSILFAVISAEQSVIGFFKKEDE